MTRCITTTGQAARLLQMLSGAAEPVTAASLAVRLGLGGNRESRRRQVREIVRQLRDDGVRIVATLQSGYWLTEDDEIWRLWNEQKMVDAKRVLAESNKRKKEATATAQGQGLLFMPEVDNKVRTGWD